MPNLKLTRFLYDSLGTVGRLTLPDGTTLYTVERPWLDNAPSISCIPEGLYVLRPRHFFRGGYDTFEITEVPGRTHILFHVANRPHEVEGCSGLGTTWGCDTGGPYVVSSKEAFGKFFAEATKSYQEHKNLGLEIGHVEAVLDAERES
jgi:hypothetical protein